MMKTFTRQYFEDVFVTLQSYSPLLRPYNITDVLTGDVDFITDVSDVTSKAITTPKNFPKMPDGLYEQNLKEIFTYGHSFVLQGVNEITSDNMSCVVENIEQSIFISLRHCYVQRWAKMCRLIIAGKVVDSVHLTYVEERAAQLDSIEIFVPVDNTSKLYVASHSDRCGKCPHRKLCARHSCSAELPDLIYENVWGEVCVPIFQCKSSNCPANSLMKNALAMFCGNYAEYLTAVATAPTTQRHRQRQNKVDITRPDPKAVTVVKDYDGSEIFVPVIKYITEPKKWQGGHHASPKVHAVSEYWRRRSKNDPTLIKVKGSIRGGTAEEKATFVANSVNKQKVYVV